MAPMPNFHACRLRDPGDFQEGSFRTMERDHDGKKYSVIMGKLKDDDAMTEQSYRYSKDTWTAKDARKHCKSHKGKLFEPASEQKSDDVAEVCDVCGDSGFPLERNDDIKYSNDPIGYKGEDIMMEKPEQRTMAFAVNVETRADGKKKLCGHAAVFNEETVIGNYFREMIMPGAFTETISSDDQRALFNHDPNFVLGRTSAGTLKLSEDKRGLYMEIDPPDTQLVRDMVLSPIERGDINQMSFSFRIKGSDGCVWEEGTDGKLDLRKIIRAQVYDVAPVTFPAYNGTDIALRSRTEWRSSLTPTPTPEPEPEVVEPEDTRSEPIDIDIKRRRLALITKEVANG